MKRFFLFFLLLFALLLPWRARVLFTEGLGWVLQGLYGVYFALMRLLLKNLERKRADE